MTTAAELQSGDYAEAIRDAWVAFGDHIVAAQCTACRVAYRAMSKDPTLKPADLHDVCCGRGSELYEAWMAAVSAYVAHLNDQSQPVAQPLHSQVSA